MDYTPQLSRVMHVTDPHVRTFSNSTVTDSVNVVTVRLHVACARYTAMLLVTCILFRSLATGVFKIEDVPASVRSLTDLTTSYIHTYTHTYIHSAYIYTRAHALCVRVRVCRVTDGIKTYGIGRYNCTIIYSCISRFFWRFVSLGAQGVIS